MDRRPIGVMDSGAGGLTVASVLRRIAPDEAIVYFGDSARNPYGERTREEITEFAGEVKDFLLEKDVKAVIIACNTITFNVPASFYEEKVPVIGMSLDFSALPKVRTAAVFATPASIATHSHKAGILAALPDADVIEVPCDGLAHAIETCAPKEEIEALVSSLIRKYGAERAEAAVFGCTHYPLVRDVFEKELPETFFLDPAEKTVEKALAALRETGGLSDARGKDEFYFSADAALAEKLVEEAFGEKIPVTETQAAK